MDIARAEISRRVSFKDALPTARMRAAGGAGGHVKRDNLQAAHHRSPTSAGDHADLPAITW